jgi:ribosomal protein S18 acetylase RimI-like enzyme
MATRRLTSFLWGFGAQAGQSPFEIGRDVIRGDIKSSLFHANWQIAAREGQLLGGCNGYSLRAYPPFDVKNPRMSRVLKPLNDLKRTVSDAWYVAALAVFPENRGLKVGQHLLREAEARARDDGAKEITLLVASFNPEARRLYEHMGFAHYAERPFVPFDGSDPAGHWILMGKPVGATVT